MYKIIILLFILSFNLNALSKADTIEESVSFAVQNSNSSALIEAQSDLAKGKYISSFSSLLPNINYTISQGLDRGSAAGPGFIGLFSSNSLSSSGSMGYKMFSIDYDLSLYYTIPYLYSTGIDYKSSIYNRNIQMTNLVSSVINAYVNLAVAREIAKSTAILKEVSAQRTKKALISFEYKIISEIDLENIQAMTLEAEASDIQAEANLAKAELDYTKIVGKVLENYDLNRDYSVLPIANLEEFITLVNNKNPQLIKNAMSVKLTNTQSALAWLAILPKLSFTYTNIDVGSGIIHGSQLVQFYYAGLTLNIPIFDQGKTWTNVYLAYKNDKVNTITNELQKQDIVSDAKQAWISYNSINKVVQAKKKYIVAAERSLERMKERQKFNTASEIDVLNEQYNLMQKKVDLLNIQKNQILSYYQILSLAGMNPLIQYK